MKRQGDSINEEPTIKKSDNGSTDLRSKIGAKLQTLLNAIPSDSRTRQRHVYENLFKESEHSEIIIDPGVVIKTEICEDENHNESPDITSHNSQNFIHSAKSRLTELLNKAPEEINQNSFKDSEKENSLSVSDCDSLVKSKAYSVDPLQMQTSCIQNSCSLSNKKNNSNKNQIYNVADCDRLIHEGNFLNLVVVLEDFRKSRRTNFTNLLLDKSAKSYICSSLSPQTSTESRNFTINKTNTIDEVIELDCDDTGSAISVPSLDVPSPEQPFSEINIEPSCSTKHINPKSCENSDIILKKKTKSFNVVNLGDMLIAENGDSEEDSHLNEDENSEIVDDPDHIKDKNSEPILTSENDPDVVLLCEVQPTYEVITLEDAEDDNLNVIEDLYECYQCGKKFRARSLLDFHVRMHGTDLPQSHISVSTESCINSDKE